MKSTEKQRLAAYQTKWKAEEKLRLEVARRKWEAEADNRMASAKADLIGVDVSEIKATIDSSDDDHCNHGRCNDTFFKCKTDVHNFVLF